MLLSGVISEQRPEYLVRLENGQLAVGFSDGTAMTLDGGTYRLVAEYDGDDNMTSQLWRPCE